MKTAIVVFCLMITTNFFVPLRAFAQPGTRAHGNNAIQQLHIKVASDAVLLSLGTSDGPSPDSIKEASAGQNDLKALIKPALAAAQGQPDLIAAIKAYYIAAHAYFQSYLDVTGLPDYDPDTNSLILNPQQLQQRRAQAQLKGALESKEAALKLEMQIAGLGG